MLGYDCGGLESSWHLGGCHTRVRLSAEHVLSTAQSRGVLIACQQLAAIVHTCSKGMLPLQPAGVTALTLAHCMPMHPHQCTPKAQSQPHNNPIANNPKFRLSGMWL